MNKIAASDEAAAYKHVDYYVLRDAFTKALERAFERQDAQVLRNAYDSYAAYYEKKSPMDQVFREMLLYKLNNNVDGIGALVRLSVDAVRSEIVSVTIPVVLLGDIFDAVTLDKCEKIFGFVEDMVEIWKEDIFFTSCKNNILRMCNDLLRRLSRAQNTVFCGRILLFLSKFFPFSERSGLNIVSEFNLDNVTEYGVDSKDMEEKLEDTIEDVPIKIDYNLYCKFWSLQDFFRNPNQCYSKTQWKMFQAHAVIVLGAFSSFKLEEPRLSNVSSTKSDSPVKEDTKMSVTDEDTKSVIENEAEASVLKSDNFFAKFLTNPKLLALQLSDPNFRRSVLVQFLILFQYLQLTVKFKNESNTLTAAQSEFINETEQKVYRLLEETPPNGVRFAHTVRHMLEREEMWNNWKNDGCREFTKPDDGDVSKEVAEVKPPSSKRIKRSLGESLREANRNGRFYLGNDVLTRLWNYSPDNLQACKSEERNFLPQLETFLEGPREKNDATFEWRALRLIARQSPHFFTFLNSPSYKVSDYLEGVRRKMIKDKIETVKAITGAASGHKSQEAGRTATPNEQETVALQDQGIEPEEDATELEDEDVEKLEEEKNDHAKPVMASREQVEELAPLIGDDWKKLGKKLGYAPDELLYFETENTEKGNPCVAMVMNWFSDDDDASLDNLAYILEGLEINAAAKAVKAIIDRLSPKETEESVEVLSE